MVSGIKAAMFTENTKGEVINLKWEHVAFDYDYYILPDPKNGEEQKIYLPPEMTV